MRKTVNRRDTYVDPQILQGFKDLLKVYSPSCVVADAQERYGVMHSSLRPLTRETRFVGPALTVRLEPGNQVDCLDALAVAEPGDVIVVDAAGETETSVWGGLMAGLCKMKGVVGAVVDGAIRDTDEIRDLGFYIFSKAIVPRSTHSPFSGRLEPIEVNVPIQCGGVLVRPGDLILGDEIGVVVIPLEKAAETLEKPALKPRKRNERENEFGREKLLRNCWRSLVVSKVWM